MGTVVLRVVLGAPTLSVGRVWCSLFPASAEGAGHLMAEVFGVGPVRIVAIAIFPLEVRTEIISATFDFVVACVVNGEGGVFRRHIGGIGEGSRRLGRFFGTHDYGITNHVVIRGASWKA